jgi:cell division initiation protein
MRITPIEIHQKKFRRALRGYNEEEVDAFLDDVAAEMERIIQENEELSEKVERLQKKLEQYQSFEQALQETMLAAQKAASDLKKNAENAARLLIKDAQLKAEQIKKEAQMEKERMMAEVVKLKMVIEEFRRKFIDFLERQKKYSDELTVMVSALPSFGNDEVRLKEAVYRPVEEEGIIEAEISNKASETEAESPKVDLEKTQPAKLLGEEE